MNNAYTLHCNGCLCILGISSKDLQNEETYCMRCANHINFKTNMEEKIKNKVREIQDKYCGESVETKIYYAIKNTIERLKYKDIEEFSLENKIKIFGWLSDSLTREDTETTIEMHEDKIKRIKKFKEVIDSSLL